MGKTTQLRSTEAAILPDLIAGTLNANAVRGACFFYGATAAIP